MTQPIKVLVVEDNRITARIVQSMLRRLGYEVLEVVSHGEEFVKRAKELRPDVVISDVELEGDMNGIEAAKKLPDLPIAFLTGHCGSEKLKGFIIIDKQGFKAEDLKAAIEKALK